MRFHEGNITQALERKHKDDIFASQVKLGPAGSKIMDAVAIKKTWSPKTVIGYEIKVTRNDFLSDQKHPLYMDHCHIFYFVAPKGIIKPEELPDGAGLLEINESMKLRTIVKSKYRKIIIPEDIFFHIMFWKLENYNRPPTKEEALQRIKSSIESKQYGNEVAMKIRDLEKKLDRYRSKKEEEEFEKLTKYLHSKGMYFITADNIIEMLESKHADPKALERILYSIDKIKGEVEKLR